MQRNKKSLLAIMLVVTFSPFISPTKSSGQAFNVLYRIDGVVADNKLGCSSVSGIGDLTGDGKSEFMASVSYFSPRILNPNPPPPESITILWAGAAYCYSGATKLFEKTGLVGYSYLGWINETIGDVNGDTKPDFLITVPFDTVRGLSGIGSAYIYSGSNPTNPSLLYRIAGQDGRFGYSAKAVGDIDGDSKSDFIVGTRDYHRAYVYSGGKNGALIYTLTSTVPPGENFGFWVSSADVNGDGKKDFIVGAPSFTCDPPYNRRGKAYVINGADGATLLLNPDSGQAVCDWFGYSVSGIGDVNADGKDDFIVGAPLANPGGRTDAGSAYVYSGGNGSLLYTINGDSADDKLGWAVAGIGDANGDGKNDFIVSARNTNAPGGFQTAGSIFVYSVINSSLTLLQRINATSDIELGSAVGGAGDVNGDGKMDFIVGAPLARPNGLIGAGSAFVYGDCISAKKGDINGSNSLTPTDIVLMLRCVYLGQGNCPLCAADMNCSGTLSPADLAYSLAKVYLGRRALCEP